MRNLAYRRFQREKHIKRKEHILKSYRLDNPPHMYNDSDLFAAIPVNRNGKQQVNWNEGGKYGDFYPYWFVRSRGYLNKEKIHCGCGMCMAKTRNKGRKRRISGNYAPSINYKPSDLRKMERMDYDEFSYWCVS